MEQFIEPFMSEKRDNVFDVAKASNQLPTNNDGGMLLVWGCGEFGQHGHGYQNDISLTNGVGHPLLLGQLVTMVACGSSHTICVTDDGRIYAWGNGNSGQLGIGQNTTVFQPNLVQLGISLGTRIKGVACGTRHTFIWTEEGDCYSFGNNFSAQLGYNFRKPDFKENQPSPVYLETLFNQKVLQVACGSRHSLFLFSSGLVASVGSNDRGQLGLDCKTSSVCIKTIPDIQDIVLIGSGNCHCLAVDVSGSLYVWGYGKACGSRDDILSPKCICKYNSIKTVNGGDSHSMLLLDDGTLLSWGVNFEGQLGQGKGVTFQSYPTTIKSDALHRKVSSISVSENTSAAVTGDGILYMWGRNVSQVFRHDEKPRYCQFVPYLVPLANWKANKVSCGSWHVACIVQSTTCKADDTSRHLLPDNLHRNKDCSLDNMSLVQPLLEDDLHKGVGVDEIVTPIQQEFDKPADDVTNDSDDKNTSFENSKEMKTHKNISSEKQLGHVTAYVSLVGKKSILLCDKEDNSINSPGSSELEGENIQANNDKEKFPSKLISMHNEVSMEMQNTFKCSLRRTQSEDSSLSSGNAFTLPPKDPGDLNHFSKSLCDFRTEKIQEKNIFQVQQSSTCEITTSSLSQKNDYEFSQSDNSDYILSKESKIQDYDGKPINNSVQSANNTKLLMFGQTIGQLNREKKQPRHLRKVSSSMDSVSNPLNQQAHRKDRYHYSEQCLQRTQSSPTINISSIQLEVFPSSQSTPPTPHILTHVPHPPRSNGLPPRHPGPRRHSQKILYSSGSSWRKRKSDIM